MDWIQLVRDVTISGIVLYFIQRIIDSYTNKKVEKYKQELEFTIRNHQLNLDTDLERYKAEMNLHIGRQNSLHDKRAAIIDAIYQKLVMLDSSMKNMTGIHPIAPGQDAQKEDDERVQRAIDAYVEYNNYFLLHKLYFSIPISELLEKIRNEYYSANYDFASLKRLQAFTRGKMTDHGYQDAVNKVQSSSNKIREEIPKILIELESEFRKMLGVM